jgi:HK97 family phage major capsid protein
MVLSISRGTTGTAAAAQATENAAVQETDFDDTKLDVNVRTYAGQQDVSRQALERSELVEEVIFGDLVADYFTKLNDAIVNADGTSGTHLSFRSTVGIIAKAYTDASPTIGEFYSATADAIQRINKQRFAPAQAIVMAPRRWGWLTAFTDSATRPIVLAKDAGPQNPLAIGDAAAYGNYVGTLHGLPVVTDASIPETLGGGTEDIMLVLRTTDHLLWWEGDGMPRQLRFEETGGGNLSTKLVVYGYSAFTAGRYPLGVATVGGTGLIAPTFA